MEGYQPKYKEKQNFKILSLPKQDFGTHKDLNRRKDEVIQNELEDVVLNLMSQLNKINRGY